MKNISIASARIAFCFCLHCSSGKDAAVDCSHENILVINAVFSSRVTKFAPKSVLHCLNNSYCNLERLENVFVGCLLPENIQRENKSFRSGQIQCTGKLNITRRPENPQKTTKVDACKLCPCL